MHLPKCQAIKVRLRVAISSRDAVSITRGQTISYHAHKRGMPRATSLGTALEQPARSSGYVSATILARPLQRGRVWTHCGHAARLGPRYLLEEEAPPRQPLNAAPGGSGRYRLLRCAGRCSWKYLLLFSAVKANIFTRQISVDVAELGAGQEAEGKIPRQITIPAVYSR